MEEGHGWGSARCGGHTWGQARSGRRRAGRTEQEPTVMELELAEAYIGGVMGSA